MARRPMGDRGRASPRLISAALAVFVAVTLDVLLGGPLSALDEALSRWVRGTGLPGQGWRRPWQRELDQLVNFGDVEVVVVILTVVLAVVCWRARTVLPFLRLVVIGGVTIATVWSLKVGFARPAPSGVRIEDALRSYPSGHTVTSVVLWGLLAAVVAEYRPRSVSRPVVEVLSWLGPVLTMTGLLLRDYHWLSDLIAGAAVGVVLVQVERLALRHWRGARGGSSATGRLGATRLGATRLGAVPASGPNGAVPAPGPNGAVPAPGPNDAVPAPRPNDAVPAPDPNGAGAARDVPAADRADARPGGS